MHLFITTLWRALLRQSARMSKITNDGLTRSGTACFIAIAVYPYGDSVRQRVTRAAVSRNRRQTDRQTDTHTHTETNKQPSWS